MTNGVKKVIISTPYKQPEKYLKYIDGEYFETVGRRPAGYRIMSSDGTYGKQYEIESVNYIREKVNEWRENGYPDCSPITKELLDYWNNQSRPKLFFCQLEAIETIIYINEVNQDILNKTSGFKPDGGDFLRQCAKMATGTGKTVVMAMLIAWQVLNAISNKKYSKNILVVSPSLIVLDRLQVLKLSNKNNIYDEFNLIPHHRRKHFSALNLVITNWHKLKLKEKPDHANHKLSRIGKEKEKHFGKRVFKKNVKDIIVINDEGHHAWRPDKYNLKNRIPAKEKQTAGIWMQGLDMLNRSCNIKTCFDFTATPFVSTGKSLLETTLFTWIISDFSLDDAVEAGLIKTPRPVRSDKLEMEKYGHIYRNDEVRKAFNACKLHQNVKYAYRLLAGDWEKENKEWKKRGSTVPPVMITVCNETKHAKLVTDELLKNSMQLTGDLCDKDSILQIDSAVAKRIEEGKEKKQDYTLREKARTVGKKGEPGEKINNIISVNMLTEGWDVKTVTHIMGLRAFSSQLLCEQVIGRGLRRTSYDVESDGLFKPEYVTILGVPYGFLPFEEQVGPDGPREPAEEISKRKDKTHQISWPIIERIDGFVKYDWKLNKHAKFFKSNDNVPTDIQLGKLIEGRSELEGGSLKSTGKHIQEVEFAILQAMFKKGLDEVWKKQSQDVSNYAPYKNVLDVLNMIGEFLTNKVHTNLTGDNLTKSLYWQQDQIAEYLLKELIEGKSEFTEPESSGYGSTDDRQSRFTRSKHIFKTPVKTHLDKITGSNEFEINIGKLLDKDKRVLSWIKADMVNFNIKYHDDDVNTDKRYRPDFIIHLNNGIQLILEGKGEERPDVKYKKRAILEWVKAVNNSYKDGIWKFHTIYKTNNNNQYESDLNKILDLNYDVNHSCVDCGRQETRAKMTTSIFKVKNLNGILKYDQVCKDCRSKIL